MISNNLEKPSERHVIDEEVPFRLITRGAIKYISDPNGIPLSDGFHSFEAYETEDAERGTQVIALIGKIGAMKHIIRIPAEPSESFHTVTEGYHDLNYRFDMGAFAARTGAMTCLLDAEGREGREVTGEYHKIFVSGDRLFGTTGSRTEEIRTDNFPQRVDSARDIELPSIAE